MGWQADNLWKTTDGGTTWMQVLGLPAAPISCIQGHPTNPNWLYAGTELGLFTSSDAGASWSASNEFPANVPIEELNWRNNTVLMAVTHGRGVYLANIDASQDAFRPQIIAMVTGRDPKGGLNDVLTIDRREFSASPDSTLSRGIPPISFEATGVSPLATPAQMMCILLPVWWGSLLAR